MILLSSVFPIILTIVPVIIYQTVMKLRGRRLTYAHYMWTYIMMLYVWLVFSVTGIGSVWDIISKGGPVAAVQQANINFVPFQSEGMFTYSMNILMFMPLGFLLPYVWREYRNLLKTALIGALFSIFIELAQLPTNRLADIDDLMMNTLGAVLGYLAWKMIGKCFFNRNERRRTISLGNFEPIVYLILAGVCNFLFYNWRWFI